MRTLSARGPFITTLLSSIPAKPLAWLWHPFIPLGKLTLLTGHPATGKTSLALDLAARLSNASPMPQAPSSPHCPLPSATLLLSPEDNLADTLRPRLESMHANLTLIHTLPNFHSLIPHIAPGSPGETSPLQLLDAALTSIPHIKLLIIDPITHYLGLTDRLLPSASADPNQPRSILHNLARLAEKHRISILLTARLPKQIAPSDDLSHTLSRLLGSVGSLAFPTSARSVLLTLPMPPTPTPPTTTPTTITTTTNPDITGITATTDITPTHLLLSLKSNLGPLPPALPFTLTNKITWSTTPFQIPAPLAKKIKPPKQPQPDSALASAIDFLRNLLADGPVKASSIRHAAHENAISPGTIRRASEALHLRTQHSGHHSAWFWSLPEDTRPIPSLAESLEKTLRTLPTLADLLHIPSEDDNL